MATPAKIDRRLREERLGFRFDEQTKTLIERATQLERCKLTDLCMTALTEAAQRTIARRETLSRSEGVDIVRIRLLGHTCFRGASAAKFHFCIERA